MIDDAFAASADLVADANPLSRREREVAAVVTQGMTNREISEMLVLSERTVDAHVEHIRAKLGVRSRAAIAAWVAASGGQR
jgi:DNA-binding NarL/FixJ family response regulator